MTERIITLSAINDFFKEDLKCVSRGENSLNSGNLVKYIYDDNLKILKGTVKPSMKRTNYEVEIYFHSDFSIQSGKCSCPRGQFICHHMACVALFGHYNLSKTDIACTWNVQSTSAYVEPVPMDPKEPFDPKPQGGENAAAVFLQNLMKIDHGIGLLWLASSEPESQNKEKLVLVIEEVLMSEDYILSSNKKDYLCNLLQVTPEMIEKVSKHTIGQSENPEWIIIRKHRLTASNFGPIIKAVKRNSFPESLYKRLIGFYNLDHVKQIQWGRQKEKDAIAAYEKQKNIKVSPTGLWLDKCGYIAGSPDGILEEENGIIEVKCPFSHRNSTLSNVLTHKDIIYFKDNEYVINKEHDYYDQIQGNLYITNRQFCDLILYTTVDLVIFE